MADKKISELNSASLPLSGLEEVPIVQDGETKKVKKQDFAQTPLVGYRETLDINGDISLIEIGDIDNETNGTKILINPQSETVKIESGDALNFEIDNYLNILNGAGVQFNKNSFYTLLNVNDALSGDRALKLPDSDGTLATEQFVDAVETDLQSQINSINFEGITSYETLADLQAVTPIPADGTTAKVANNTADETKNGNWYVSGGVWVQFDQTVENVVEETNTSKGVTGKAVLDFDAKKNVFTNDSNGQYINNLASFIRGLKISNSVNGKYYAISYVQRGYGSEWKIVLSQYDDLIGTNGVNVSEYKTSINPENNKFQEVTLTPYLGSGISCVALVKWENLPNNFITLSSVVPEDYQLADVCFEDSIKSITENDLKRKTSRITKEGAFLGNEGFHSKDKYVYKPGQSGVVFNDLIGTEAPYFNVFENGINQTPWDYDGFDTYLFDGKYDTLEKPVFNVNPTAYERKWYVKIPENLRDKNVPLKITLKCRYFVSDYQNAFQLPFSGILPFSETNDWMEINNQNKRFRFKNRLFFEMGDWRDNMRSDAEFTTIEVYYFKDKFSVHVKDQYNHKFATWGVGGYTDEQLKREFLVLRKYGANYAISEITFEKFKTEPQKETTYSSDDDVIINGGEILSGSMGSDDGVIAKIPINQNTRGVVEFDFTPSFDPHSESLDNILFSGALQRSAKVGHFCQPLTAGNYIPQYNGGFYTMEFYNQNKKINHKQLLNDFTFGDAFSIRIKTTESKTSGGLTYNECKPVYVGCSLSITSTNLTITQSNSVVLVNLTLSDYDTIGQLVLDLINAVPEDFVVTRYFGIDLPIYRLTKVNNLVLCVTSNKFNTSPTATINDSFEVFIPINMKDTKNKCVFSWDNEAQSVSMLINGFEIQSSLTDGIVDTYSYISNSVLPVEFSDTFVFVGGNPFTMEKYNGKIENIKIHNELPYGKRLLPLYSHPVNLSKYDYNGSYVHAINISSNLTLSGLQTIDGVSLQAGNIVWAGNQSDASEIDAYIVSSGAWVKQEWGLKPGDGIGVYTGGTEYGGYVVGIVSEWVYEKELYLGATINQGNPLCRLTKTIDYLKSKGVVFINSKTFSNIIFNGVEMPEKCSILAFDDGGYDTWWDDLYVRNTLLNSGTVIDLPIATEFADTVYNDTPIFMRNFEHAGNAIACHSNSHDDLELYSYQDMLDDYQLAKDWFESKGYLPRVNYYPKGSFTNYHAKCLQHFGFPVNFRVNDSLYYRQGGDLKAIGRISLYEFRWEEMKRRIDLFFDK